MNGKNMAIGFALLLGCSFLCSGLSAQELTEPATPATKYWYKKYIKNNAPSEDAFVAIQRLAYMDIKNKAWDKAAKLFESYQRLFPNMTERFEKVIALLQADEEGLIVQNLGAGINSAASEYVPTPTADGTRLYFTGLIRDDGLGLEDIFVSVFSDGRWQPAQNLGPAINSEKNESLSSVSADNNMINLFGNYDVSLGRGDNFYCERTAVGWGPIQHFNAPVNSSDFDASAMFSSDGRALFFTSDRLAAVGEYHKKGEEYHGSYWGNTDIFVCTKTANGWSDPINLGETINTPFCEYTPFLHPDGKTLYFSSDGHYHIGGLDVFKTTRLNDSSWTEWSEPINLGKEINGAGNDWGYKVATSGDIAYFSAFDRSDGYGQNDIYSITLPKAARAEAVVTIRGKVLDGNGDPLPAHIKWEDLSTGEVIGELKTDPADGTYFIPLPVGKNYAFYASLAGYLPVSQNIDLRDSTSVLNLQRDIQLISIDQIQETGLTVKINNLFFDHDKSEIKKESYSDLNRLAEVLKKNKSVQVEIAGHTDNVGNDAYNQTLSEQRASAVVKYLQEKAKLGDNNLIARGYGESKPVMDNDTEAGRAANRRVEFRFIKDEASKTEK